MRHPLQAVRGGWRLGAVIGFAASALVIRGKMQVHAKTKAAPHGMMSLVLAGDPKAARRVVASWNREVRQQAELNLRLDPLFSLAWTTGIAAAVLWAGRRLQGTGWPGAAAAVPLAWGQWLAAALSAAKDAAALAMLRGRRERPLPAVAWWCTVVEISLKAIGVVYCAAGGVAWGWPRASGTAPRTACTEERSGGRLPR